jgi:hypothetical protein
MNVVWVEVKRAAKEAPLMYFAPLLGAWRGIRMQYRILDRKFNAAIRNARKGSGH